MKTGLKRSFDPEGKGYDLDTALGAGLRRDPKTKHWPSREPKSGLLLKGRKHPTWKLLEEGEEKAGMTIKKRKDGRYISE